MTLGGKISNDGKHGPKFKDNPTRIYCANMTKCINKLQKKKKIWKRQIYTANKVGVSWKNLELKNLNMNFVLVT